MPRGLCATGTPHYAPTGRRISPWSYALILRDTLTTAASFLLVPRGYFSSDRRHILNRPSAPVHHLSTAWTRIDQRANIPPLDHAQEPTPDPKPRFNMGLESPGSDQSSPLAHHSNPPLSERLSSLKLDCELLILKKQPQIVFSDSSHPKNAMTFGGEAQIT